MHEPTSHGRFLTPRRLRLYPAAALVAVVAAFAFAVLSSDGTQIATGRLGGDFPAFYAAGTLVADGKIDELYRSTSQLAAQEGMHAEAGEDQYLVFPYPPFVALIYVPFSWLPYKLSFVLHTCLMAALLAATARLLIPLLPRLGRHPVALFAAMVVFYPVFRALVGGQNTPLTMFLLALAWHALQRERPWTLGTSLAAMLYKPQFSLTMTILAGTRPSAGLLLAWLAVAAAVYVLGAAVGGLDWISWWLGEVSRFHLTDQAVNAANAVSILGFLEAITQPGWTPAVVTGLALSGALGLWLVVLWVRRRESLALRLAVTFAALALVQPHAMYYDGGIALLSVLILLDHKQGPGVALLAALYAAAYLTPFSRYLGFNPLFFVLLAILAASVWTRRNALRSAP